jgi:hypothetical protein
VQKAKTLFQEDFDKIHIPYFLKNENGRIVHNTYKNAPVGDSEFHLLR